ncbi:hypothetical protein ACWZHB_01365 [Nocardia sp. FBN12]|uniref:hypothetical protein n=1 Tax=Nocardia sp. FBN12 TaxID=3419766 RepID=UPI003D08CD64
MYDLLMTFIGALIGAIICLWSIVTDDTTCERSALLAWRVVCAYTVASILIGAAYATEFIR